jgi:hypothetical protein
MTDRSRGTRDIMRSTIRVLLADDHAVLREATAELTDRQPDIEVVGQTGTGQDTIAQVREMRPDQDGEPRGWLPPE